jgi:hypothetical protein
MASSVVGQQCGNCYGEGHLPTDQGPVDCPDCGGEGILPTRNVLVDWRAREIERVLCVGDDQIAHDVGWLIFELRRARSALTQVLALAEEIGDESAARSPVQQMRFIANDALGLYSAARDDAGAGGGASAALKSESKPSP